MVCKSQLKRKASRADELAALVHPRDGHPKLLAMLNAYMDESGIHDEATVCVVAGYFSGRGQWRRFEENWKRIFDRYGVELADFHAKDFVKQHRHSELISALANVIAQHAAKIHPVSHAISVEDFNSFSLVERRFLTGATLRPGKLATTGSPNKPYYVPFVGCMRRLAAYAPVGGKVHFFFGLGRTFSEYALVLFNQIKNPAYGDAHCRERLGDISFPEAKDTPQLQAADLLVHLTYQHAQERMAAQDWNQPPKPPLSTLLSGLIVSDDHLYDDRQSLQAKLDLIPKGAWGNLRIVGDETSNELGA